MIGATLGQAITATFARRGSALPVKPSLALTAAFSEDMFKQRQWQASLKKNRLPATTLLNAVFLLHILQWPATQVASIGSNATANWFPQRLVWA